MKKIIYNILICSGLLALASCEKKVTTEDPSTITHYVVFELNGDQTMLVPLNSTFTDPGVVATENGADVNDHVIVTITDPAGDVVTSIPTNAPGLYTVEYKASNADGFSASTSRTVIVYDPSVTATIAGTYSTDIDQSIYNSNPFSAWIAAKGYPGNSATVTFTEIAPGFFSCNDLLAGWYGQIRGYGAKYYMTGIVTLNADNSLTLISSYIAGWGDGLDYIKNAVYDPATGTITYDSSYAGQIFISPVLVKQ
jgi:hypothetical protein